jgi:hypothetical protein
VYFIVAKVVLFQLLITFANLKVGHKQGRKTAIKFYNQTITPHNNKIPINVITKYV